MKDENNFTQFFFLSSRNEANIATVERKGGNHKRRNERWRKRERER